MAMSPANVGPLYHMEGFFYTGIHLMLQFTAGTQAGSGPALWCNLDIHLIPASLYNNNIIH